ncbi:MAG: T9SS type A sorting domain-containing protein, partial [Bacteroidia bacterium]
NTGIINTVAGNGKALYSSDSIPAISASLGPYGIAVDSFGNLFIADCVNNRIRKVNNSSGLISTVAGNGSYGFSGDGGLATGASLNSPFGIAIDASGNLFISDCGNLRVRKVSASTGIITTIAGNGTQGYSGDGGPATLASLKMPKGLAVDKHGNIYVADIGCSVVRKIDPFTGLITTVAGNGIFGFNGDSGLAIATSLYNPFAVALDTSGNLFIADRDNNRIRKVNYTNVGINEILKQEIFNIFPNPAKNELNILTSSDQELRVQLFDVTGKLLFQTTINSTNKVSSQLGNQQLIINLQQLPDGIYFLRINNENENRIATKKIVVMK